MKKGNILSIACVPAAHKIDQQEIAVKIAQVSGFDDKKTRWLQKMYKNSKIAERYSVLEEYTKEVSDWRIFTPKGVAGTQVRNELYKKEAPKLSLDAARKALCVWGRAVDALTHIIFVSCTGVMAPGVSVFLQQELGLKETINQIGLNMMGCFGAFKGLDVANAYAQQDPNNRILLVCTELCTLHFQPVDNDECQVGNCLFSDGAAACIVGQDPVRNEKKLWSIERFCSQNLTGSLNQMTWEVSDSGFLMGLKAQVPKILSQHASSMTARLLGSNVCPSLCDWPIHPGGKNILLAIEQALEMTHNELAYSWKVLEKYGNMSSATFLFVLEELNNSLVKKPWAAGFGFGPGLTFEGILLHS